jgi:nucleotide-binding universal stress UspA family protein
MLASLLIHLPSSHLAPEVIRPAVAIAKRHQARVRSLAIVDIERVQSLAATWESAEHGDVDYDRLRKLEKKCLAVQSRASQACLQAGLNFDIRTVKGESSSVLQWESQYHDLVVTVWDGAGDDDEEGVENAGIRSTDELAQVMSNGSHSLLLLRGGMPESPRVLLVHDGSDASGRAIRRYVTQRLWLDSEVRLLGVAPRAEDAAKNLRELVDYCATHGLQPETGCLQGTLRRSLVPYARKWEADLIVLGAGPLAQPGNPAGHDLVRDVLDYTDAAVFLR